jgi:hypothetical protein
VEGWSAVDLLPGVLVALLAFLLDRVLRRWYDPVPVAVWGICGGAVLLLLFPVLFQGAILLPLDNLRGAAPFADLAPTDPHGNPLQGDLIQLIAPSLHAVRGDLLAGRWPLWNELAGPGMPLLTDPQAQPFQPLTLPALLLPFLASFGAVAALRLLCAQLFFFLLLRRQGLKAAAALVGALSYGLGGFLLLWLGWPIANSAALLPAVLYAAVRCIPEGKEEPGRCDGVLLATTTAGLLLAGHPETILYALLLLAAFLTVRLVGRRAPRGRACRITAGALLVAGLVTAPVLLPTALYLPTTARAAALEAGGPTATGGVRALLPTVAPNTFGNSRYAHYWGPGNSNEDASAFVGTAALLAALLALPGLVGKGKRLPQEWLVLLAGALAAAAVAWPGLFGGGIHGHGRLRMVLAFSLAYLAACTVERCRRGDGPHPAALVGGVAALAAVHLWAYRAFPYPDDPARLEILRHGWLLWHLRFLAGAAALLLLGWGRRRWRRRDPSTAVWARGVPAGIAGGLVVLVAAELLLAHGDINPPMPRRLAFPETPALAYLRDHSAPGERMAALGDALPPNLAQLYGLNDVRIYNPAEPLALRRLMAPITEYPAGEVPRLTVAEHPLYDQLAVRYLLTEPGWELPGSRWVLVFDGPDARIYRRTGLPSRASVGEAALPPAPSPDAPYRPPGFLLGCLLAALGVAWGLAWGVAQLSRRRGPGGSCAPADGGAPRSPDGGGPRALARTSDDPAAAPPG